MLQQVSLRSGKLRWGKAIGNMRVVRLPAMKEIVMQPLAKPDDIPLMFEAAVAKSRNELFLACSNRDERFDGFARLCLFRAEKDPPWTYFDLPVTIADATSFVPQPDPDAAVTTSYVFLEEDGDVFYLPAGREPETERIVGSGLWSDDSEGWGYVKAITQIGNRLHACGGGGQVYRRLETGVWEHIDEGLLQVKGDQHDLSLRTIAGPNEQEIYVGGWRANVDDGVLYYWGSHGWEAVAHNIPAISSIHIEHEASVWACGRHGTLLHGNHIDGFRNVLEPVRSREYLSVTIYGDQLFLATNLGLYVYVDGSVSPVKTGLVPEFEDGHILQVVDGVLWAIGYEDIVRFDGKAWERIPFLGNPPIG
ncbi:hypothetical protein ACK83U_18915 (plasmid) [Rhizobium sp. WW22]|uniref:hypothetical protein n=1 Tax=Rhizobium sp. WW22 TaxID=3389070 RepID=UPI003999DDBE